MQHGHGHNGSLFNLCRVGNEKFEAQLEQIFESYWSKIASVSYCFEVKRKKNWKRNISVSFCLEAKPKLQATWSEKMGRFVSLVKAKGILFPLVSPWTKKIYIANLAHHFNIYNWLGVYRSENHTPPPPPSENNFPPLAIGKYLLLSHYVCLFCSSAFITVVNSIVPVFFLFLPFSFKFFTFFSRPHFHFFPPNDIGWYLPEGWYFPIYVHPGYI